MIPEQPPFNGMTAEGKLEYIADILDDFYEPIATQTDGGEKLSEDKHLPSMQECMAKLMGIWMELRPGSSYVGMMRNAMKQPRRQG